MKTKILRFIILALVALTACAGFAAAETAVEAKNPTTVCNPIDLEYMFHRGKLRTDGRLEDLFVESADPAMCVFKGENHELSRSGKPLHRIRRLKEITQWFKQHLKD